MSGISRRGFLAGTAAVGAAALSGRFGFAAAERKSKITCGTDVVATGCPFCFVMIDDGVRDLGVEETVIVKDIAMLLADSIQSDG